MMRCSMLWSCCLGGKRQYLLDLKNHCVTRSLPADANADAFVLTMILGSVGQLNGVEAKAHGK